MAPVSLRNVVKFYGNKLKVVKGIDIEIEDKEFIVFIGPSGCGKTTTLRMIAGLETISSGEICIGNKRVRYQSHINKKAIFGIRPENLALSSQGAIYGTTLSAKIEVIEPLGSDTLVYFRLGDALACARVELHAPIKVGEEAHFVPDMTCMHLFESETGLAI